MCISRGPRAAEQNRAACTEEDAADGKLYRLYLELGGEGELAQTGIHFKVALETHANPATGQLTATAAGYAAGAVQRAEDPSQRRSACAARYPSGVRCGDDDGGFDAVERPGDNTGRPRGPGYPGRDILLVLHRGRLLRRAAA